MNERRTVRAYRDIRGDYAWKPDIMSEEDPRVAEVKRIIQEELTGADRILITMYADCQSLRKLGRALGISHTSVRKEIVRIRKIILDKYGNIR